MEAPTAMSAVTRPLLNARFDKSALRVLGALPKPKILVTVESALYFGCCGGYEEKSLKVEAVAEIKDSSHLVLISEGIPIHVHKDAVALIESRGGHFTIYADLNGHLYSDQ